MDNHVWVDGSCKGKYGGWAYVVDKRLTSGKVFPATNNRMELTAIKKALGHCHTLGWKNVTVHTDSKYAIGVCSGSSRAKANVRLVHSIRELITHFENVELIYEADRENSNLRLCHNSAIGEAVMGSKEDQSHVTVRVPLVLLDEIQHFLYQNNAAPRLIREVKECKAN